MEKRWIFVFILIMIMLCIDFYVLQAIKSLVADAARQVRRVVLGTYWAITVIAIVSLVLTLIYPTHLWPKALRMYLFSSLLIIYLSKLIVVLFLLVDDLLRLGKWSKQQIINRREPSAIGNKINRNEFISQFGLIVASIPFFSLFYGMIKNAYDYQVKNISLKLENLPDSFEGLKIIQISDIHTGSFTMKEPLYEAVKLINKEEPDLIFFTGDIVNYKTDELEPYIDVFSGLKAKKGIYSVLGNHDYGDYIEWPDAASKKKNLDQLLKIQKDKLGWKVLLNENEVVKNGKDELAVIGVENWSNKRRFRRYGDLEKALAGTENAQVKLLLSHDPSHWNGEITSSYTDIDVTFSGHTHGMQFGVEIPGFKWSPVQYLYKQWAGLYKEGKQQLYVNRGFGFIGYPGRVGILPEITVFKLEKG